MVKHTQNLSVLVHFVGLALKGLKPLTIFIKSTIVDVWQVRKNVFVALLHLDMTNSFTLLFDLVFVKEELLHVCFSSSFRFLGL